MEIVLSNIDVYNFNKLNLCIFDSMVTAIIGDNASGKSIIGEVIATVRKPKSGKLIIDKNVLDLNMQDVNYNQLRFDIGMVIQNTDVSFFERTVEEHGFHASLLPARDKHVCLEQAVQEGDTT